LDSSVIGRLAARLYARRKEAVSIERVSIEGGDWQPDPNECHANVSMWRRLQPNYIAVRGWLVADYSEIGLVKFFAHSVVQTEAGELLDITPNPLPWHYPFLTHHPADGDFGEIVEGGQIEAISYPTERGATP
jgi:hypothetical protein